LRDPSKKIYLWKDMASVRQKLEELDLVEPLRRPS